MLKYGLLSVKAMILDGELNNVLGNYDTYLDFLEDTWFYDGELDDNMEEYCKIFEPIIINYYEMKGQK